MNRRDCPDNGAVTLPTPSGFGMAGDEEVARAGGVCAVRIASPFGLRDGTGARGADGAASTGPAATPR